MGYGRTIYNKAINELEKRKQRAEYIAENNLYSFYAACPRAEEISRIKSGSSAKIAKAVLGGANTRELLESLRIQSLELQQEFDELLMKSDFTTEDITPQYVCSECSDTGFIDGKMCKCLRQLQKSIAYENLNLQTPLSKSDFASFSLSYYTDSSAYTQMERILNFCKSYAENFSLNSRNLLFRGATGLGKTHLSLAIAGKAIDKGYGVIYASTQNLAVSLEKERFYRVDESKPADTNSQLLSCDLLILDDLGAEFSSGYVSAAIYNVINTRSMMNKPTIISTNLTMKELEKRYSERFISRIVGNYAMFEFMGKDIRFEKRRKSGKSET